MDMHDDQDKIIKKKFFFDGSQFLFSKVSLIIGASTGDERVNCRKGTLMIALMVVIGVMGLISYNLIPDRQTETQRRDEQALRTSLAEVRQAFDLKEMLTGSLTYDLLSTGSVPIASITAILKSLQNDNLLRSAAMTDSTFFRDQWGLSSSSYWVMTSNIPFNNSFEASVAPDLSKSEFLASWSLGTPDTIATHDKAFWLSRDNDSFDDYRNQNKFGKVMTSSGTSMRVDR